MKHLIKKLIESEIYRNFKKGRYRYSRIARTWHKNLRNSKSRATLINVCNVSETRLNLFFTEPGERNRGSAKRGATSVATLRRIASQIRPQPRQTRLRNSLSNRRQPFMQTSFRRRVCFYRQQRQSFFLSFYSSYNIFVRDLIVDKRKSICDCCDLTIDPCVRFLFINFAYPIVVCLLSQIYRDLFIILFVKTTDRVEDNLCNRDLETKRTVNRQTNNTYYGNVHMQQFGIFMQINNFINITKKMRYRQEIGLTIRQAYSYYILHILYILASP